MGSDLDDRQLRILRLLDERGASRVSDLADELGVSAVTARRDVAELDSRGLLRRTHGRIYGISERQPSSYGDRVANDFAPITTAVPANLVVGMLMPRAAYYYADVIKGARAAVAEAGGRVVLGIANDRVERDVPQLRSLTEAGVHGVLATPTWRTGFAEGDEARTVLDLDVPVVLVERRGHPGDAVDALDRVCTDHAYGAHLAVRHLVALGRTRVVFVTRATPTATQLRRGFHEALAALGLEGGPRCVIETLSSDTDPDDFERVADALLALRAAGASGGGLGVLVHNDMDAVILEQILLGRGVSVPRDVALVAYDDETAALADVPLTAVAPPKYEVGYAAAHMLMRRIAERGARARGVYSSPTTHTELLPRLLARASSGVGIGAETSVRLDR